MKRLESVVGKVADAREAVDRRTRAWCAAVRSRLADTRGQGTTEYAILVGVQVAQDGVFENREADAAKSESFGLIIGAIQGVREILERYRDDIGAGDLFAACASLEKVEGDLFDKWDEV